MQRHSGITKYAAFEEGLIRPSFVAYMLSAVFGIIAVLLGWLLCVDVIPSADDSVTSSVCKQYYLFGVLFFASLACGALLYGLHIRKRHKKK